MLLQPRLPWNKLIHNADRNINSSYVDNECKKIFCTSMKRTNLRQFILVSTKIIKTKFTVHLPNELNQNHSQHPNWSCNYKTLGFSLTLNLFPAFYTIFWSLVPQNQLILSLQQKSLLCQISEIFQQIAPTLFHLSACHLIYTQPVRSYFKQTKNLNLSSKHANLHLKSVTFSRRDLFAWQTKQYQFMLCHSIANNHCSPFSLS